MARLSTDLHPPAVAGPATREEATRTDRVDRITLIRPATRWPRLDVRELWAYRELLGILVWRDLKVRYKQSFIGIAWAIFQPALIAVVYTIVFGRFAKFPSSGIDYPVFVFAGLLPWMYFSSALSTGASSLVSNVNLVTKVYFPRLLLPGATVFVPLVDLALGCVVLVVLMAYYDAFPEGVAVLASVGFVLLAALTALGSALWLSAVNVRYRDVPYAIPVFMQVLPLLSGVPFAINQAPEKWQWILSLNPMTAVISGWRWAVLDAPEPNWGQVAVGVAVAVVVFLAGLTYFRSSEPRFADTI
jgi:homopolymeric O-antigen transport system permease protein